MMGERSLVFRLAPRSPQAGCGRVPTREARGRMSEPPPAAGIYKAPDAIDMVLGCELVPFRSPAPVQGCEILPHLGRQILSLQATG